MCLLFCVYFFNGKAFIAMCTEISISASLYNKRLELESQTTRKYVTNMQENVPKCESPILMKFGKN